MSNAENNGEWARVIYKNQLEAIENAKRRQWAITNYILLIFAAIIGFSKLLVNSDQNICLEKYLFLIFAALFISLLGIYHLFDMHGVMVGYRNRVYEINKKFSFTRKYDPMRKKDISFWNYLISITFLFVFLITIGFVFVLLYINKFRPTELKNYNQILEIKISVIIHILWALSSFGFSYWQLKRRLQLTETETN